MELETTVGHQWHTIFLIDPTNPPHQHTLWFVNRMMPAQATRQITQPREMDGDGQETWSAKPPIVSTRSPGPSAIVSPGPRRRNRGPEDAGNAEEAVPRPEDLMDGTFDEKHEATLAYATRRRAALTPFLPKSTIFFAWMYQKLSISLSNLSAFDFCFQFLLSNSSILTSRFVANGRFSASFRPCASHFIRCIDTSTYPAHLGTMIYWPDWLPAPEPAGTSLFCTGKGGKSLVAAKSFLHNSCNVHAHTALMRRPWW
jgi:hypothetical protein